MTELAASNPNNSSNPRSSSDLDCPRGSDNAREVNNLDCDVLSSPWSLYQSDLQQPGFEYDAAQEHAVKQLQSLYERLLAKSSSPVAAPSQGVLSRLFGRARPVVTQVPEKGLYFWGGVGRGKTYLMDNFYKSLPFKEKMRVHFHRFMRQVHHDLTALDGEVDPLEKVAEKIAAETRVICFDEFFVSDIADAMLLGTLLGYLFDRGVTLVATSNIVPDRLYENGLQRRRFLPAIALLNQHTEVINVDGGVDYRLRTLARAPLYHHPLNELAEHSLAEAFANLTAQVSKEPLVTLTVEGRPVVCRAAIDDVVWFDFGVICDIPRSQNDYIELAKEFHTVLVSGVPQMGRHNDDQARRFINLVDEFYDRSVKLVLSASVPMVDLYTEGRLRFEFDRTQSRLLEMQSHDYLARPHQP